MRIDKYLWATRYYKTRSKASEACKKGHVKIAPPDGGPPTSVKPSKDIFIGERVTVRKNQINYTLEILDLPPNRVGAKLVDRYRKDTTPATEFENREFLKHAKQHYRKKGTGRPTKKDRRDLEDFTSAE